MTELNPIALIIIFYVIIISIRTKFTLQQSSTQ
jgi:hypothetical protein